MQRLDPHDRLDVVAAQQHGVRDRTGLTETETDGAAWTVAPNGARVGGARSIALALAVARNSGLPTLPWKIPGVPWVLDRIYGVIAANRRRLPGDTPWCVEHPDRCESHTD